MVEVFPRVVGGAKARRTPLNVSQHPTEEQLRKFFFLIRPNNKIFRVAADFFFFFSNYW